MTDQTTLQIESAFKELLHAYEETIDSWAQALEFRDQESQGHTKRVAEITVHIARALDISESEIIHIRHGAMLHDVGKMAIPDVILLKNGPLLEEERDIMRKHTEYAHQWLAPIKFLAKATDIPYCHHEKWDGTGYPRGLKGEQIPLAARIFALVDVWDALRSDRPFRKGWSFDKVAEYHSTQAGKHFDPNLVPVFLREIEKFDSAG
jgi:putative nucleotidyltransferase with HDIG domain